jgi:polygalacturonase
MSLAVVLLSLCGACTHVAPRAIPDIPAPKIPDRVFRLTDYGAVADGKTLNTKAIASAIAACTSKGGGKLVVPAGVYLTGPIQLASNLELHLEKGATLLFTDNPDEYPVGGTPSLPERHQSLLSVEKAHDIAITGKGKIDGQGAKWWEPIKEHKKKKKETWVENRPKMLALYKCERVRIADVTLTNSPMFHMSPTQCTNVICENVTVIAPKDSPNTDSFNPSGWNILVRNCTFDIGDDNVAVKPFTKPGDGRFAVENLYITGCTFRHGHGLSVGGQTPGGLRNMRVWDCTFDQTDTGIRLKAERGDGGDVQDIVYENLRMKNVRVPIAITSYYHGLPKPGQPHETKPVNDRTPIWKNIRISNVTATGAKSAGLIMGLPEMPASNIMLENVKIDCGEPMRIGYANGLKFINVQINATVGKPFLIEQNVSGEGLPAR